MIDLRTRPAPATLTVTLACDCCGAKRPTLTVAYADQTVPRTAANAVRATARVDGWHAPDAADAPAWCAACDGLPDRALRIVARAMGVRA